MISAIKSDNPIELLNYISNTFRQSALTSALQQHLYPVHTYSVSHSGRHSVYFSIPLSHCPTVPPSHCPSGSQSVSQCVMSLFCHSIRGECQPWPVARIGMAHICLFDIVAHSCCLLCSFCIFLYDSARLLFFLLSKCKMNFHVFLSPCATQQQQQQQQQYTHIYHAVIILERSLELKTREKLICFDLSIIDDLIIHRVAHNMNTASFLSMVRPLALLCLTRKPIS